MPEGPRLNLDTIAFVVVVSLLAIGAAWVVIRSGADATPATTPVAVAVASPSPEPGKTPTYAASTPVKPGFEDVLRVVADARDCRVQVRRNGAKGVVLFSGIITQGSGRSFKGPVLWARVDHPSAVRVIVQGRTAKPIDSAGPVNFVVRNGKLERQG
jgi:hypothetical protein